MKNKRQEARCPACGYVIGNNHDHWCPKLHPDEWSWFILATSGPTLREHTIHQATLANAQELTNLFRFWISHQKDFASLPLQSFTLEVFHRFRELEMHYSTYTVSFAGGKKELWGNSLSRQEIRLAWEAAGGVYREG